MEGKKVLITGAANGLGKALTEFYLAKNWHVIATDVDLCGLDEFFGQERISIEKMDVSSDSSVSLAFHNIKQVHPQIDLIINNAGIDRYFPFSEAPVEMALEVFQVNLFGSWRVNQTFLPIVKSPGGMIIHIGSESLHLTIPFMPYAITKNAP
ncbi:MAG: SDR family NAD(P)-dependent oxidoreductase [Bacteroidota bacterium]